MNRLENKRVSFSKIDYNAENGLYHLNDKLFSGIVNNINSKGEFFQHEIRNGLAKGCFQVYSDSKELKQVGLYNAGLRHGYNLDFSYATGATIFTVWDMENILELISVDKYGNRREYYNILGEKNIRKIKTYTGVNEFEIKEEHMTDEWKRQRKQYEKEGYYEDGFDILPYYELQTELSAKVIAKDELPEKVNYIAGVDVAYNELEERMVGAIIVLKADTLEVVEQSYHEMAITFPYIPGLFSFREIPPILKAYKKLKIKPDLIICDAQGIAHPKGVGMATHLGIELNIPTIGCAKKRLIGMYDKGLLGDIRGDTQPLIWDDKIVGVALRTQSGVKPTFVSIGHKISLETAVDWVLKLCPKYRLPETTRQADQLVNKLMKERTEIDFMGDDTTA